MSHATLSTAVDRIGRAALSRGSTDEPTEGRLLSRFVQTRDEPVFGELVRRLGPMVLAVCRRVSGDVHLADDAFQAAFLVLARRAADVRPAGAVRGWLYGVAVRTAREARAVSARLRSREVLLAKLPDRPSETIEPPDADAFRILDEEIAALPEHLRAAVVLCEIDGQSRRDAAERLGIPEGTLSSRLAKARRILAEQLRRRGVALSAAMFATAAQASAAVPPQLVEATTFLASAAAPVPPSITALSTGVMRMMLVKKLKAIPVAALLALIVFAGGLLLAGDPPQESRLDPKPVFVFVESPKAAAAAPQMPRKGSNKILAYRSGQIVLLDPDGKNERVLMKNETTRIPHDARLSPDGSHFAVVMAEIRPLSRPSRQPMKAKTSLVVKELGSDDPGTDLGVESQTFCWSPDGTEIAFSDFVDGPDKVSAEHGIVDVKTKKVTALTLPADHIIIDWTRDGKLLTTQVAGNTESPRARLYLMNRDGSEVKALTGAKSRCVLGKASPDGRRVLYMEMKVKEETPAEKRARQDAGGRPPEPARQLMVLTVADGKSAPVADLPLNSDIEGYCWSPDGKQIAYIWRETFDGKPEELRDKETESFLIVCDPDGKNQKTIATEKARGPGIITLAHGDWGFVAADALPDAKKDEEKLQGKWKIVSIMDNGKECETKDGRLIFAKDKVTLEADGKSLENKYKLDPSKKPKWFDLAFDGRGRMMLGIYELDGDKLKICVNEDSFDGGKRSTAFESKSGTPNDLLIVLERETK